MTGYGALNNDIAAIVAVESVQDCQSICSSAFGCMGFTYLSATQECFTKSNLTDIYVLNGGLTALVNCTLP